MESMGIGLIAYLLDLCSVVMNQGAFALQKLAHRDDEKMQAGDVKGSSIFQGKRAMGYLLMIVGALLHVFALAHADLILLSCNALMGSIANVMISTKFLGERFDPRFDLPGLTLMLIGCMLIVMLSNKDAHEVSLMELVELVSSMQSICYLCSVMVVTKLAKHANSILEKSLRYFEQDCMRWEQGSQYKVLPSTEEKDERPEHILIAAI